MWQQALEPPDLLGAFFFLIFQFLLFENFFTFFGLIFVCQLMKQLHDGGSDPHNIFFLSIHWHIKFWVDSKLFVIKT